MQDDREHERAHELMESAALDAAIDRVVRDMTFVSASDADASADAAAIARRSRPVWAPRLWPPRMAWASAVMASIALAVVGYWLSTMLTVTGRPGVPPTSTPAAALAPVVTQTQMRSAAKAPGPIASVPMAVTAPAIVQPRVRHIVRVTRRRLPAFAPDAAADDTASVGATSVDAAGARPDTREIPVSEIALAPLDAPATLFVHALDAPPVIVVKPIPVSTLAVQSVEPER